jgi:hypothetical protein
VSRKREDRRKKKAEMARQLGVSASEVDSHHHLQERERVTRPELRLVELHGPPGLRSLVAGRRPDVVIALFVVETRGPRLVGALKLGDKAHQLERLSYTRPAHFVLLATATKDSSSVLASFPTDNSALKLSDLALDAPDFASNEWEEAREVEITGLPGATTGAAMSLHGVGRSAVTAELPLGKWTALVEVSV